MTDLHGLVREAEQAFADWSWKGWVTAGRVAADFGESNAAESLLGRAMKEARQNPNGEVKLACAVEVALTAAHAGIEMKPASIERLGLTEEGFAGWEEEKPRD